MILVVLAAALVAGACGSDTVEIGDGDAAPATTASPTTTAATVELELEPVVTTTTVEPELEPVVTTTTAPPTPVGNWTARSVVVDGVELLHPTNAQTLTIIDGTVSANDGCNTWSGGSARWDTSGMFSRSGNSTSTAQACANGQDNADAFNAALRATTRWAVTSDGVLLLTSPTSRIELS